MVRRAINIADIAASIALGVFMIYSAYGGNFDPRQFVIPSIASLLFPFLWIFTILLMIVNIFVSRPACLVNFISLLLCLKSFLYFCPLNVGEIHPKADFTLMSYNVQYLDDLTDQGKTSPDNPTLGYILEQEADIVVLQECNSLYITNDGSHPSRSVINEIKRKYPYMDFTPSGQALLSTYPFERVPLEYPSDNSFRVTAYDIFIDSETIRLLNVHLQSIGLTPEDKELYMSLTDGGQESDGLKNELKSIRYDLIRKLARAFKRRAKQMDKVMEIIDSDNKKTIVCGDFNDITLSNASRRLLDEGFTDAYRQSGFGPGITYHDKRFYFRIDQIFYRGDLQSFGIRRDTPPWSDHYPLLVDFSFTD